MTSWTPAGETLTELFLEMFRVNGDLISAGDRIAGEFGQSSARWQVLGAIHDAPRTVPAIARQMGLTRQAVQRTVDVLADESIVEYLDNPAHRRSRLVAMTPEGQRIYSKIVGRQVVWVNRLAARLHASERDIRSSLHLLQELREQLEQPIPAERKASRRHESTPVSARGKVRR